MSSADARSLEVHKAGEVAYRVNEPALVALRDQSAERAAAKCVELDDEPGGTE